MISRPTRQKYINRYMALANEHEHGSPDWHYFMQIVEFYRRIYQRD